MLPNLQPYFADLADPRRETKNKLHKLQDIVMIVRNFSISRGNFIENKPQRIEK
jgi:hypothetical protein